MIVVRAVVVVGGIAAVDGIVLVWGTLKCFVVVDYVVANWFWSPTAAPVVVVGRSPMKEEWGKSAVVNLS